MLTKDYFKVVCGFAMGCFGLESFCKLCWHLLHIETILRIVFQWKQLEKTSQKEETIFTLDLKSSPEWTSP